MNIKHYSALKHKEITKCIPKGKYRGNYKCHVNSLEYARLHSSKVKSIVGVLQVFDNDDAVAHFIVELLDGTYIDPSYGIMLDEYRYNIIIEHYNVSTFNANRDLGLLKEYLYSLLPWYIRLFTTVNTL